MLQRKQSVYLLVAFLFSLGLYYFDVYHALVNEQGAQVPEVLTVSAHFPSLLVALLMTVLSFLPIWLFTNRPLQMKMIIFGFLSGILFTAVNLIRISLFNQDHSLVEPGSYWIGSMIPIVYIILMLLAYFGVRKDHRLVKSMDRLR